MICYHCIVCILTMVTEMSIRRKCSMSVYAHKKHYFIEQNIYHSEVSVCADNGLALFS